MRASLATLLVVGLFAAAVCATNPLSAAEVPTDWAEPEYAHDDHLVATLVETDSAQVGSASHSGSSHKGAPGVKGMYPAAIIPGPWFGSFASRMDSLGYSIPPYAFDPKNYAKLGPYRALTNKYSDGTAYPLNMQKYDYFPYDMNGNYAPSADH